MIDTFWYNLLRPVATPDPTYLLEVVTPPVQEPVSYSDLTPWMRLDQTYDQAVITAMGTAAREVVEDEATITLVETTFKVSYDRFDHQYLRLPRRPANAVLAVTYIDPNGIQQTLDPSKYYFDRKSCFSRIRPVHGTPFPHVLHGPNSVSITFTAGFAVDEYGASDCPEKAKTAIKMLAAHWNENREAIAVGMTVASMPLSYCSLIEKLSCPEV